MLQNLSTISPAVFELDGIVFAVGGVEISDGAYSGYASGVLAPGDHRFEAGTYMTWGSRIDRGFPGSPLDLALAVPEPSAGLMLMGGLVGLGLRRGRDRIADQSLAA